MNSDKPINIRIIERGAINSQAIISKIVEHAANSGVVLVPNNRHVATIDIETCDIASGIDFSVLSAHFAFGKQQAMEKKIYIKDSIKHNLMNKNRKGERRR